MSETLLGPELIEDDSLETSVYKDGSLTGSKLGTDVIVDTGNQTIDGVKTFNSLPKSNAIPSADNDLVNKKFVSDAVAGRQRKESCHFASIADIGGSYSAVGGTGGTGEFTNVDLTNGSAFSLNGLVINLGERVLVRVNTDAKQNGIYVCTAEGATGTLERSSDMDEDSEVQGAFTLILDGGSDVKGNGYVVLGENAKVLNVDNIDWTEDSLAQTYTASLGVKLVGLDFQADVDDVTINLDGSDKLQVKDNSIDVTKLAPLAKGEFYYGNDSGQIVKAKTVKSKINSNDFSSLATGGTYTLVGSPMNVLIDFEFDYRGVEFTEGIGNDYTIVGTTLTYIRTKSMKANQPIKLTYIVAV